MIHSNCFLLMVISGTYLIYADRIIKTNVLDALINKYIYPMKAVNNSDDVKEDDYSFFLSEFLFFNDIVLQIDEVGCAGGEVVGEEAVEDETESLPAAACVVDQTALSWDLLPCFVLQNTHYQHYY